MRIRMLVVGTVFAMAACASGGAIDLSKIPPPTIVIGTGPAPQPEPPPLTLRATVAFVVFDAVTRDHIPTAIATFEDGTQVQANDDGYIAVEKELNTYQVKISADDYLTATRNVVLTGNRQFDVPMTSTKPASVPPTLAPTPVPPVVTPNPPAPLVVVLTPLEESAGWSDEQWRAFIMPLLKKTGDLVNEGNLKLVRPELVVRGADFQNGWRGDLRARVFLPVPGCASSASRPDAQPCAYNRTFDLGLVGELWQWIKR